MSVAMLGDYMAAADDEREIVVRNAKYAKKTKVKTYREARRVLRHFLTSPRRDVRMLYEAIESWKEVIGNPLTSESHKEDLQGCVEVLLSVIQHYNVLGFSALATKKAPHSQPKLNIQGLSVSTYLDALLYGRDRNGDERSGGIHLQLSKGKADGKKQATRTKRENAGQYASLIIYQHVQAHFPDLGAPRDDLCQFSNVRKGRVWTSPEHKKRMLDRLDAAARVICATWPTVPPPLDFDPEKATYV